MARRKREPIIVKAFVKTADGGEVDVDTLTPEQKREYLSRIGYMPQESALYPQLTVAEFLAYMAEVKGVKREAAKKSIVVLVQVHLQERFL